MIESIRPLGASPQTRERTAEALRQFTEDIGAALVFVCLPTGDFLALSRVQFEEARRLGHQLASRGEAVQQTPAEEPLLTAEQMEERTSIPASWFLEQARRHAIPHVRFGKYVRFSFSDVHAAGLRPQKGR